MASSAAGDGVVLAAWARGLAPDPQVASADWVTANLVVPDGPRAGQRFDMDLAPYARGILEAIDDETVNRVSVRKSAQVAFTTIATGWVGRLIDKTPSRGMIIFPTLAAVQDYNREKLQPTIEATPPLRRKVVRPKSRSTEGSTSQSKRYPGGSLTLTGANSAADLRSKTTQFQLRDEIDEWPIDLDGQGDPVSMADARLTSFRATGDWKVLEGSTPTIKGASRIDAAFEAGDQRFWEVPCPHCGEFQVLEFGGKDAAFGLKFSRSWPHEAHYVCRANGCVIEHHEKPGMVRAGRWMPREPGPGRHPSFHVDALMSLVTTWDAIAAEFAAAQGDRQKLKGFVNLTLGQSWEERGEAPDWQLLMRGREGYPGRVIPPGGLVYTGFADVQQAGLFYEIVAWGADGQSWSIDIGFLEGDTAERRNPVWARLDEKMTTPVPSAAGGTWPVDLYGVDSGFYTNTVYEFCRRHPKARATKGDDGWHKPAISSAPQHQQVTYGGKRRGVKLWRIGTWPLKAQLYGQLRLEGIKDGAETYPPGFCHFSDEVNDEGYFRQLTAEHLKEETRAGRVVQRWVESGPNHYLDCRIGNMAMAEMLGVGRMTPEQWADVMAKRGEGQVAQADLLDAARSVAPPASAGQPKQRPAGRRVRKFKVN